MNLLGQPVRVLPALVLLIPAVYQGAEPEAISISPLGGRRGTSLEATVRGKSLQGTYALWFDQKGITARIKRIEELESEGQENNRARSVRAQRVVLGLQLHTSAPLGRHSLRLVSPQGVSGPIAFLIHDLPSVAESKSSAELDSEVQQIGFPCVINGVIRQPGERDTYAFRAGQGQHLRFELISNPAGKSMGGRAGYISGFDSVLALYQPGGSWFEEGRSRRLAFDDKSKSNPRPNPQIDYRFQQRGRYLLEVGSFYNLGSEDFSYQLRITPAGPVGPAATGDSKPEAWQERSFSRRITPDRIEQIWSRTVDLENGRGPKGGNATSMPDSGGDPRPVSYSELMEKEPNDQGGSVAEASLPFLVKGTIDRPGDVDYLVSFRTKPGEKLSFELETPEATLPDFNPRLAVLDEGGRVVLTNVYRRVVRQLLSYSKTIEPKTVHTFLRGGTYTLRVRDTTHRNGSPAFRYRVLVRYQIPHAGELAVKEDRLNLVPGAAGHLTVTTGQEEGFAGQISLRVEGLPPGVEALPSTNFQPEKPPHLDEGPKERFLPALGTTSIVIVASSDAPVTRAPQVLQIKARPIVSGKIGPFLSVGEVHLMVLGQKPSRLAGNSP